jgi:enterochelin esterase family protein
MGGYGALRLAFFAPERFAATASLSGALHETVGIPGVERPVATALQDAERWYHGAYGRPFDIATYIARNPFSRIGELSRMQAPPKILITTGDDDYFKFYEGSCALFVALRRAGLAAELRVDDGGHDWQLWGKQFPEIMRFFAKALHTREPG